MDTLSASTCEDRCGRLNAAPVFQFSPDISSLSKQDEIQCNHNVTAAWQPGRTTPPILRIIPRWKQFSEKRNSVKKHENDLDQVLLFSSASGYQLSLSSHSRSAPVECNQLKNRKHEHRTWRKRSVKRHHGNPSKVDSQYSNLSLSSGAGVLVAESDLVFLRY